MQYGTFVCSKCGRGFAQSGDVIRHERDHCSLSKQKQTTTQLNKEDENGDEKKFACEKCEKKFKKLHLLTSHMRTHTGEKMFGCDECGKKFGQSSDLKIHERIHTGEKPFKCSHCKMKFANTSNFYRHQREMHQKLNVLKEN